MKSETNYPVSVLILTYYPDYEKLFQTVYSVLMQKGVSFQIVVSDDGTFDFDVQKLERWFREKGFTDYTIINNPENQGTVKNIFYALEAVKGTYVKLLSPGDYLYDENALKGVYEYMKQRSSEVCFGRAVYYRQENNSSRFRIHNLMNPRYIRPFLKNDLKKIQKNCLLYKDYILGASLMYNTQTLKRYLSDFVGKVIYVEDIVTTYMVAEDVMIDYWDGLLVWYEYGYGVSTGKDDKWSRRIWNDTEQCFRIIVEKHPKWQKMYDATFDEVKKMKFLKRVRFSLNKKRSLLYRNFYLKKNNYDRKLLEQILEQKEV